MRKTNYLVLLFWCLMLAACTQQAEVTPELNNQRSLNNCILDPQGNCIPGGPTGGNGGNNSSSFKVYMKGESSSTVNQGASSNGGTSWLAQGGVTGAWTEFAPSAVKYNGDIYVFYADLTNINGVPPQRIAFSRSTNSGFNWTNYTMDNGVSAAINAGTSAVAFNGQIYLAYKRVADNSIRILTSNGLTGWSNHSEAVLSSENTSGGEPYLAVHNNELYVFYTNNAGRVFYKKLNTFPSLLWDSPVDVTAEVNSSTVLSSGGVTAVSFNNTIHVIYKTNSDHLIAADALSLGTPQGHYVNNAQSSERPSVATDGTRMVLLYKSQSNVKVRYSTSTDGQTWFGNAYAVGDTRKAPYVISF